MASSEVSDPAAGLILPSILVNSSSPYGPLIRGSLSKAASSHVLMTTRRGIEDIKRHSGTRAPKVHGGQQRHSASLSRGPRDGQHRFIDDMDAAGASSPEKCSAEWAFISRSRCFAVLTVQILPIKNIERRHCPLAANGMVGHSAPTVRTTYPSHRRHQRKSRRPLNCGGVVEPSSRPRGPSQAVNENRNPSFLQWRASVSPSHSSMAMADTLVSLRRRPTKHNHALDFDISVAWPRAVCLL